jgi:phytoene synthase
VRAAGCDSITTRAHTGKAAKLGWLGLSVIRAGLSAVQPGASVLHAAPVHEVDFLVDAAARGVQRRGRSESLLSVLAQLEARDRGLRAQRRA